MDYKQLMVSWVEEGTVSIPQLLLSNYHKLGLSESEFVLLLQVFSFIEKGNDFPTPEELSSKMSFSSEECSSILRRLVQNQFIAIEEGNSTSGILYEKYSLKPLWTKLAEFVLSESKSDTMEKTRIDEADLYTVFEQEFSRPLSPLECETLAMWVDQDEHNAVIIKAALREAVISGKLNFRYIDRILFEWKKNGVKTIEQAKKHGERFRPHQKTQSAPQTSQPDKKTVPFYNWLEQ
ncbi:DnaD domain-containing protein [Bacillus sp. SG-1]|uniref:DnaD domain-containing protein n=1 Tax=Bacillus sp. SG-1 TaxID=161544 RepID=UPI0001545417|nr:DnaD domain-containing protein [Bacillus sp. SG-1]EDL63307.1 DNA replication protein [Bacillus sp. SG-1]